jgi:hypothetical protein
VIPSIQDKIETGVGEMNERAEAFPTRPHVLRFGLAAIVATAIVAGIAVWLIFRGDGDQPNAPARPAAVAASPSQLRALPGQLGHDVFWAGSQRDFTYELTKTNRGKVFVRYLPPGVELNDPRPNFLTVGTYPRSGAYPTLRKFSKTPDAVSKPLAGGGIAVYSRAAPQSVYVAYPDSDLQIEVYAPGSSRALRLVLSGQVKPIR